jgi:uncharacterized protein YndB with AHSA1/START domain
MTDAQTTSVSTSIVVDAPADRAFTIFTEDMESWWPPDHHVIEAPLSHMVFETKEGGDVYDVGTDGSECRWARVLAYDPPHRVVFSWDVTTQWKIETDLAKTSEVEVRFVAEGTGRTRVELEHRHLDRHGDGWEGMRDAVGSPEGWNAELRQFAERLQTERVSDDA